MIHASYGKLGGSVLAVVLAGSSSITVAQSASPDASAPGQPIVALTKELPRNSASEASEPGKTAVTVVEDTLIQVRTMETVNSKETKHGTPVLFMVSEDVMVGDVVAIPRGAIARGVVMKSKKAGRLTGSPELTLELSSLELGGKSYQLYTYPFKATGVSKTQPTERKVVTGAAVGAMVGSMATGVNSQGFVSQEGNTVSASGMAAGAGVGAGIGTAIAALSPGPGIRIPAEAQVDFYLASPLALMPVSAKEAARMGQGLRRGGPVLYLRSDAQ